MNLMHIQKTALVALVLMCSGMATASSGRLPAPTRRPPARPDHVAIHLPEDLARTSEELEATRRRLATTEAILRNAKTALVIEEARNASLLERLREAQAGERKQEADKCHYLFELTKQDGRAKQLTRQNRLLREEVDDLRAENEELRSIPGVNRAIAKHNANAAKNPLQQAAENVFGRLKRSDTTVVLHQ